MSVFVLSCKVSESQNARDPQFICGGIKSSEVGIVFSHYMFSNSTLESDGIHSTLSAQMKNCTGQNQNQIAVDTSLTQYTIASLSNQELSLPVLFDHLITPIEQSESVINYQLNKESQSRKISLESIQPQFVAEMSDVQIVDGATEANGDSYFDPGEKILFKVKITNTSETLIKDLGISLSLENANFGFSKTSDLLLGDMLPRASLSSKETYTLDLSSKALRGLVGELQILLKDKFGHQWSKVIRVTVAPRVPPSRKIQVLNLASNMVLSGLAVDSQYWYLMLNENLGNSVVYRRIYRKKAAEKSFTHLCSFLEDPQISSHLAVDNNKFYIPYNRYVRTLKKNDCSIEGLFYPKNGVSTLSENVDYFQSYYNAKPFSFAVDSGKIYYNDYYNNLLLSYDLDTTASFEQALNQWLGDIFFKTSESLVSVFEGIRWSYSLLDNRLWKFDEKNQALARSSHSISDASAFNFVRMMAVQNPSNILLLSKTDKGPLKFITVDASSMEGSDRRISFNTNEEMIELPASMDINCPANSWKSSAMGCVGLKSRLNLDLPTSSSILEGVSSNQKDLYVMTLEFLGNDVAYRKIYKSSMAQNKFNLQCEFLNEDNWYAHLFVDDNYFYTLDYKSVLKYDKNSCGLKELITPVSGINTRADTLYSSNNSYNYTPFTFSVEADELLLVDRYNNSIFNYNLSTRAESNPLYSQQLGLFTATPSKLMIKSFSEGYFALDVANNLIWKFDKNYKVLAFFKMPIEIYPDLNAIIGMDYLLDQTLMIYTYAKNNSLKIYNFDVSGIDKATTAENFAATIASSSLPNPISECPPLQYRASNQSCVSLNTIKTYTVSANSHFVGLTADSQNLYFALSQDTVPNAFIVYKFDPNIMTTAKTLQCSVYIGGMDYARVVLDAGVFYIGTQSAILRVNAQSCAMGTSITPPLKIGQNITAFNYYGLNNIYNLSTLTVEDGNLLYKEYYYNQLVSLDLSTKNAFTVPNQPSLGSRVIYPSTSLYLKKNGFLWAIDEKNHYLWKFDAKNNPVSYFKLPYVTYPDLDYIKDFTSPDGKQFYIATERDLRSVKIYSFDLSLM